jgi:thiol-disulfide isomerase/thioredoxin
MEKKLVCMLAALAITIVVGCSETKTTSGTAATATAPPSAADDTLAPSDDMPTATDDTAVAAAETSNAEADSEVIQASASVEEPAKPSGEIGAIAPAWEGLTGTDDKQHSLRELADAKAVAVVFTCNTCPVAKAYQDRLKQLADDYKDKGIELVAINVNKIEGDTLPDTDRPGLRRDGHAACVSARFATEDRVSRSD